MINRETYEKGVWFAFTITALVVFIGSWIYCIANYGFLLGVGLGWLPSAIVAVIAGAVVGFGWPLVIAAVIIILWAISI